MPFEITYQQAEKGKSTCTVPLPLVTNQRGEEFLYKIHMYIFMADSNSICLFVLGA